MTSAPAGPPVLRGDQQPRITSVPPFVSTTGAEAIECCALAGLHLDPWQELVLSSALGEREDGKWAAFEVGLEVSRQNGKGSILEARELTGLFVLDEGLIIHSAHEFATSLEAFRRLLMLIEDTPDFDRRVKRVSRAHGEEGIELKGGQRIRFRTRTKGGGRGFTGDCLLLDEAMIIPRAMHGALLPTLSARPNPQVWYTGTAVDQEVHEHGVVFASIRERGMKGGDPSLAYFEFSAEGDLLDLDGVIDDERAWAAANPGLGIRISSEHVGHERRSMDPRTFAVERLGIGDWPRTDGGAQVIALDDWLALADPSSRPQDPVCFAFDVTPDRAGASIAVCGLRTDGFAHLEIVERKRGTGWVPGRVAELVAQHSSLAVICDAAGPAASLLPKLQDLEVDVMTVTAQEHAQGCGLIYDAVAQQTLRHLGTQELTSAIKGAVKRPLGDAWAWSRKNSGVDISPLVAITLALWGTATLAGEKEFLFAWA